MTATPTSGASGVSCHAGSPVRAIGGPLHTCGGEILTASDHPVRLLSLGVSALQGGEGQPTATAEGCPAWDPLPRSIGHDVERWGFNSVRLNVSWANLQPERPRPGNPGWNTAYLHAVDAAIASFSKAGLGVIVQMAQNKWSPAFRKIESGGQTGGAVCQGTGLPAWLYPNGGGLPQMVAAEKGFFEKGTDQALFRKAWTFLAGRYAANRHVIGADILNEPYDLLAGKYPRDLVGSLTPASLDLRAFYEKAGRAIHAADPNLLLLFQDHVSKRLEQWGLTGPPELPNAVMVDHFYEPDWIPNGRAALAASAARARGWDVPLWIGEFTAYGESVIRPGPLPHWAAFSRSFFAYCKAHSIGWAVWVWGRGGFQLLHSLRKPKPQLLRIVQGGI